MIRRLPPAAVTNHDMDKLCSMGNKQIVQPQISNLSHTLLSHNYIVGRHRRYLPTCLGTYHTLIHSYIKSWNLNRRWLLCILLHPSSKSWLVTVYLAGFYSPAYRYPFPGKRSSGSVQIENKRGKRSLMYVSPHTEILLEQHWQH